MLNLVERLVKAQNAKKNPMQQLLIIDELDTWSQDNYPDLVRALMLAR